MSVSTVNALANTASLSPTLAANEKVLQLRQTGQTVLHMGFGQAPFSVHPRLLAALQAHASNNEYLPVAGLPELQSAILQHHAKLLDIEPNDYDVLIAPGSKLILYVSQLAIEGDLLLPTPSWVSYAPQAELLGQTAIPVSTTLSDAGLQIDPGTLDQAVREAQQSGLNPTKLLINFPSNPTGMVFPEQNLVAIASWCRQNNITLISDEIYGRLTFSGRYQSALPFYPEGTILTTGLSKGLSLGGWRFGLGLIPKAKTGLIDRLRFIASETWSCVASPIQYAALEAYSDHADVEEFIEQSTLIHQIVNTYIAKRLNDSGIPCALPQGGFYTWPDFTAFAKDDMQTSEQLAAYLLDHHSLVSLPGTCFGETPSLLKLRLSGCDYDGDAALVT
ncbi:MAG: aminotransferase class I/II-fold pyridoxal phosphate-dependent enzyme, partial [Gammaproteobacteria bacterium]|nr:aminotransferase class I/II-fold pyridoxal phosphate-dependent enzyme [Gammaproteobacteria bacterium]